MASQVVREGCVGEFDSQCEHLGAARRQRHIPDAAAFAQPVSLRANRAPFLPPVHYQCNSNTHALQPSISPWASLRLK